MKNAIKILFGIGLIAAGVLWILSVLDVITFSIFFPGWWALFIIVPCFLNLFTDHDRIGSIFGILIGVILMLCAQGTLQWSDFWKFAISALLIMIGLKILIGKSFVCGREGSPEAKRAVKEINRDGKNIKYYEVQFGKEFLSFDEEIFEGVDVKAGFGAVRLDLRKAHIQPDAVIRLDCSFCGVEILLPDSIVLKLATDTAFGGIDDKRNSKPTEGPVTLYLAGQINFGGIEIKN